MSNLFEQGIMAQVDSIVAMLETLPLDDKVAMLNQVRAKLHQVSPFKNEPVDFVEWVPNEQVQGNDYNPNTVAPPEMRSLKRSITQDGYTMGIVSFPLSKLIHAMKADGLSLSKIAEELEEPLEKIQAFDAMEDGREVVDGFHRHRVGKEDKSIRERVYGYLPLSSIKPDRTDPKARISATIRHNRARGVHGVMPMTEIVATLVKQGWSDVEISKELGMDADEVLRFKQNCGLPELFKSHEFSASWE